MHKALCSETKQNMAAKWQKIKHGFLWSLLNAMETKFRVHGLPERRSHEKHLGLSIENPEKRFPLTKRKLETD